MMVGRGAPRSTRSPAKPLDPLLKIENLTVIDDRGLKGARPTLSVRGGEILGIARVDANGQSELIDAIAGLRPVIRASQSTAKGDARAGKGDARRRPRSYPEDRHRRGLVCRSLTENLALHAYRKPPMSFRGFSTCRRCSRAHAGCSRSSTARRRPDDAGGGPVGRQSAEGRPRTRDRRRSEGAHRRSADPRPRRRRDRVRPPPPDRAARCRARDPPRLARARGDPLAVRPHPRHVRGPHRRRVPAVGDRRGARVRDDRGPTR